jgi:hypothetical protein
MPITVPKSAQPAEPRPIVTRGTLARSRVAERQGRCQAGACPPLPTQDISLSTHDPTVLTSLLWRSRLHL